MQVTYTEHAKRKTVTALDVVYALNGTPIAGVEDLKKAAATLQPGAAAVLLVERGSTLMYLAFRVER